MNGRQSKKIRKDIRRAYEGNKNQMLARVIKDMEANPDFCLAVHNEAVKGRVLLRIKHAWRLIDTSPHIKMKW